MSDHEVSKPAQSHDVDDAVAPAPDVAEHTGGPVPAETVDAQAVRDDAGTAQSERDRAESPAAEGDHVAVAQRANEGLAEAARAADAPRAAEPARSSDTAAGQTSADASADDRPAERAARPAAHEDPDLAAFHEAEAAYPGTFGGTFTPAPPREERVVAEPVAEPAAETVVVTEARRPEAADTETRVLAPAPTTAVPTGADSSLPIFVQAPDAPRERSNRGVIFGIGLVAAVAFAVLYLGTALGIAAIGGKVTADSVGTYLLAQVRSAGLWVPVVVFAIGFWILGGIINRGRWGFWVVFGIIVGLFAYAGHILGVIGSVEFWKLGSSELAALTGKQLLAPLAIAAFVFGRELTIWFGAWAAKTGARRTAQNEEAQREYERILEAGPQLQQQ